MATPLRRWRSIFLRFGAVNFSLKVFPSTDDRPARRGVKHATDNMCPPAGRASPPDADALDLGHFALDRLPSRTNVASMLRRKKKLLFSMKLQEYAVQIEPNKKILRSGPIYCTGPENA